MEGKILTTEERKELLGELKIETYARYSDRIKVILLLDEGKTYKSICDHLFIDEGSIRNWRKRFVEGGLEALVNDNWSGKRCLLSDNQLLELSLHLEEKTYQRTKDIVAYVFLTYKVKYSVAGMTKLLHVMGFSYKKSKGVPAKANQEEQLQFLKKYSGIKPHGLVYFVDSAHPRHCPVLGHGWIKKGEEKEVLCNTGRSHLNITGAVNAETLDIVTRQSETIDAGAICNILKAVRDKNKKEDKIYIVLDNARYNRSYKVQKLARKLNIRLIYLPPYSPNLNLAERLWRFYRDNILVNQYFETLDVFSKSTAKFFRGIRKYKKELETLLVDNFQVIGT